MGSAGDADEVAKLAPFLASDESSFISGSEFVIDGGLVTEATAKELRRKILSATTD
jgi:3alpha(or 20beta)-hydroxysteroid dehydrogenase